MNLSSLLKQNSELSSSTFQLKALKSVIKIPFAQQLNNNNLFPLKPTVIDTMQINLGKLCNQVCEHCHVDAGPGRTEIMTKETLEHCLSAIKESGIKTVDLTGGAPEMNSNFKWFINELAKLNIQIIVRSNLTILTYKKHADLIPFFAENKIVIISSLPCYTKENVDKQRGNGVFSRSIKALLALNKIGYGMANSGLELNLVYNPGGASLPPNQLKLESDYKKQLKSDFNIQFNNLYTITNLPISRFLDYLIKSNKFEDYMNLLIDSYNPNITQNVMCRSMISVGWDGLIYDCDFNQMLGLSVHKTASNHIKYFDLKTLNSREIIVGDHCYGCTAGEGSSCQGALTK